MSWKSKALAECARFDIEFEDISTQYEYTGVLRVIYRDRVILFAEAQEHIVRKHRYPGSIKDKFWCAVYDTVMGGTIAYSDWHNHMSNCRDLCTCGYPLWTGPII